MDNHWCGEFYGRPDNFLGGARIMILGEAHYDQTLAIGEDVPAGYTRGVVEWYLQGGFKQRDTFFNRVERLVSRRLDRGLGESEKAAFWNAVVFYNYIPVIAASKVGQRPLEAFWHGRAPGQFYEVARHREVEAVLVCGTQLWRKKHFDRATKDAYQAAGRGFEAHEIQWSEKYGAIAAHIPHPSGSRGWSYERSLPVRDFLFSELDRRRLQHGWPSLEELAE